MQGRVGGVKIQSLELLQPSNVWAIADGVVRLLRVFAVLALLFFYLDYVLSLFPGSRQIASGMLGYVTDPLNAMGTAFVNYLPSLLFLVVLVLVTKLVLGALRLGASSIEHGLIVLPGFHAEWVMPTYRLVYLAVIGLALVVAFPYIPGSSSPAFQGLSIFAGVLFSLGSTSFIGNIMAGYALIYWRALRVGDVVQIDDTIGVVSETRLMVTHLRTVKNVEVVIPNATIMTGKIKNFTSLAKQSGLILHTAVGIGYETPWRQVEAMLLIAAERTKGVLHEPKPFVLQRALGDFAVTYEINAYTDDPRNMLVAYHELHRNILDLFNEYGVQIMTPAYEGDPAEAKVVPREKWHTGPALPPGPEAPASASQPAP
jgi:small-conductance mechanosensitive channel